MTSRTRSRIRNGLKRILPDRAIRILRAARGTLQDEAWSTTTAELIDPTLRTLGYWPGGRQNPYLKLLYSRVPEVGFAASPLTRFSDLDDLSADAVFHLHWTRGAQVGASSRTEAEAMTADYLRPIEEFVERGGTLLWSVHEEAPHDIAYVDVEARLRSRLANLASGIHLLHTSTAAAVEDLYTLSANKTFVVEHPLYTGYYPEYVGRAAARRLLGIADDTALLVGFGAIRPYKGFDRLIEVSDELGRSEGRLVHVIVAGPTMQHADVDQLRERAGVANRVTLSTGPVPESDVQLLFQAADVIALPYRKVMSSGVLMLGLTFGRTCVAPRNPITEDAAASGLVELFDASSNDSLLEALRRALTTERPDGLPEEFIHRYDPFRIAGEFARHLTTVTGLREQP
jgi:glycosyltransferase involved in cell wall biosynthesis